MHQGPQSSFLKLLAGTSQAQLLSAHPAGLFRVTSRPVRALLQPCGRRWHSGASTCLPCSLLCAERGCHAHGGRSLGCGTPHFALCLPTEQARVCMLGHGMHPTARVARWQQECARAADLRWNLQSGERRATLQHEAPEFEAAVEQLTWLAATATTSTLLMSAGGTVPCLYWALHDAIAVGPPLAQPPVQHMSHQAVTCKPRLRQRMHACPRR